MITLTYDDTERLGRVRVSFSGYSTLADFAIVERSTDQVTWSVIRGGATVPVNAGAGSIDDYEFSSNVPNYYRVTAYNEPGGHLVGVGTAAHADNASVVPTLPAGLATGDLIVVIAANSDLAANPNVPAGYTLRRSIGNFQMYYKIATASESNPTITFTGSGAGDSCSAQAAAFRFVDFANRISSTHQASTAQNIDVTGVAAVTSNRPVFALYHGWKADDWTSVAPPSGTTEIGEPSTTLGADQGLTWAFQNVASGVAVPNGQFVVTGGASALTYGGVQTFNTTHTNQEIEDITPVVTRYRIKSPTRPSLNMIVQPVEDKISVTRSTRSGTFEVLGRTLPVAVIDKSGSRRTTLMIDVKGDQEKEDTDRRLASGGVYQLHTPDLNGAVPNMYFLLQDATYQMDTPVLTDSYTFTLSMLEVARPPSTVHGATSTWQTILDDFTTWSALIAAEATWSDVVDRISDSDVIVP